MTPGRQTEPTQSRHPVLVKETGLRPVPFSPSLSFLIYKWGSSGHIMQQAGKDFRVGRACRSQQDKPWVEAATLRRGGQVPSSTIVQPRSRAEGQLRSGQQRPLWRLHQKQMFNDDSLEKKPDL